MYSWTTFVCIQCVKYLLITWRIGECVCFTGWCWYTYLVEAQDEGSVLPKCRSTGCIESGPIISNKNVHFARARSLLSYWETNVKNAFGFYIFWSWFHTVVLPLRQARAMKLSILSGYYFRCQLCCTWHWRAQFHKLLHIIIIPWHFMLKACWRRNSNLISNLVFYTFEYESTQIFFTFNIKSRKN